MTFQPSFQLTPAATGGGGGVTTISSLDDLPGSPSDGDQVLLRRNSTEVDLRYNGTEGDWVIAGTPVTSADGFAELFGGEYVPKEIYKLNDPSAAAGGGSLTITLTSDANSNTDRLRLRLPVLFPTSVDIRAHISLVDSGGSAPSTSDYRGQVYVIDNAVDASDLNNFWAGPRGIARFLRTSSDVKETGTYEDDDRNESLGTDATSLNTGTTYRKLVTFAGTQASADDRRNVAEEVFDVDGSTFKLQEQGQIDPVTASFFQLVIVGKSQADVQGQANFEKIEVRV